MEGVELGRWRRYTTGQIVCLGSALQLQHSALTSGCERGRVGWRTCMHMLCLRSTVQQCHTVDVRGGG
jgi:hypothetical protein